MPNREDGSKADDEIKALDDKAVAISPSFSNDAASRMNSTPLLDYLVIAAHPDDAEIGAGGTILALKAQGARVGVLDLTNGEPTPHGTPEIREKETAAATAILGRAR